MHAEIAYTHAYTDVVMIMYAVAQDNLSTKHKIAGPKLTFVQKFTLEIQT